METKMKKLCSIMIAITFFSFGLTPDVFSLPDGANITDGNVDISLVDEATMNINQVSDQATIEWYDFSIALGETVNFFQPNSQSLAINSVTGGNVSQIFGNLNANGQIWLLNPSGVVFGASARVNAAGLLASTLNASSLLNNSFLFTKEAGSNGYVINKGQIVTGDGGYVALLGDTVTNEGIIQAKLGKAVLASGEKMTLELDDQGIMSVAIEEPVSGFVKDVDGNYADDAIKNTGTISCDGGSVVLTASVLGDVFERAVNNEGLIEAHSLVANGGEVYLLAEGEGALASNTGTIDVSASEQYADGGFIEISGDRVNVSGHIAASSINGKPGHLLLDPVSFAIVDGAPGDDLGGSTVGEDWLEAQNGFDITIQTDLDVEFQILGDNELNLVNFDTETFRIESGNDINLNDDSIVTNGGDVELFADFYGILNPDGFGDVNLGTGNGVITHGGDVTLSGANLAITAPIDTRGSGGDVTLLASKNITHGPNGDVTTDGGKYTATADGDYTLEDGSTIMTVGSGGAGNIEITAGGLITMGSVAGLPASFDWEYLRDERTYKFLEMGYYYRYCANDDLILSDPFVTGDDIHTGSGTVNLNLPAGTNEFGLYVKVKEHDGTVRTYFTNPVLNPDGTDHIKLSLNGTAEVRWEDMYYLGDKDFDDIEIVVKPADFLYGTYLYGDRVSISSLGSDVYQNSGRIFADTGAYVTSMYDMIINSVTVSNGGAFLKSSDGSIFATEVFVGGPGGPGQKNVVASGYSYFSTPNGTLGVGTPSDETLYNPLDVYIVVKSGAHQAVPLGFTPVAGLTLQMGGDTAPTYMIDTGDGNGPLGVSGAIRMLVRPGVTAVTGVYPSPAIDLISDGGIIPPGYAFYEDIGAPCVDVNVTPPPRFKNGDAPGQYEYSIQIWPAAYIPPPPPDGVSAPVDLNIFSQDLRFKIPRKFLADTFQIAYTQGPIELTSGQVFFYHPLYDMQMYEMPALGTDVYEFIDGFINTTNPGLLPMLGPGGLGDEEE
ncbi:MAG: filamentous hemagglutinin N-terminal domain-containing protein [Candidatus Omnitrophica bacterium]|nr:filamentous hemagglutinin N-terminal domain-containing protein [Candidatus Omnitrophota bacterium]